MSFPPATEMFQFAGFASRHYGFMTGYPYGWVAPFGDPGINDRSHLPRAFRSVPRPSSPLSAKASTRCPSFRLIREAVLPAGSPTGKTHPGTPPRTGASASREARARQEANSPGKRLHDSNPAAASRMKTLLSDQPHGLAAPAPRGNPTGQLARARGSSASVIFTNPFHPSINTAAAGSPPAASPRFSERRSQRSRSDRTDRARSAQPPTCSRARGCLAVQLPLHLSAGKAVLCLWWR